MKNKTKYIIVTLCMLVGFLLAGAAIANAETTDITEIKLTGNYEYGTVRQEYYLHLILELILMVLV